MSLHQFKLSESFLELYKNKEPEWGNYGALAKITYLRSYSRIKEDGTYECFSETVTRVVEGIYNLQKKHCESLRLNWDNRRAQKSAQVMFERIFNFKFLPPGRGLFACGTPIVDKSSACLYNCGVCDTASIHLDFADPFCWAMSFSLYGVGIGYTTNGANKFVVQQPKTSNGNVFQVPDSREGWVEALDVLLKSFENGSTLPIFDFSLIRPLGAPIKTFGGTAPGPEPLKIMLKEIESLLLKKVNQKLSSVDIVDLMNYIGKAVVSGGIRRTALLALGSAEDTEFVDCKNPVKYEKELDSHRWASNNSVVGKPGMDYSKVVKFTEVNGEPGYLYLDNARSYGRFKDPKDDIDTAIVNANPCGEIFLEDRELCNIGEIFPARHDTVEDFYLTLKYAYLYCKTITLAPTHSPITNQRQMSNRRIGLSLSGVEQSKQKFGTYVFYNEFCDKGYEVIKKWDKIYSDWLCIPRSKRYTAIKPSGSVSLLCSATPGVHAPHSEFYFRTMRINHNSPLIKQLYDAGYRLEYSVIDWKSDYLISEKDWKDYCIRNPVKFTEDLMGGASRLNIDNYRGSIICYFPIKESNYFQSKTDQTIQIQCENAAKLQYYWADNAVSVTVNFKPEEAKDIKTMLEIYDTRIKGISFLPLQDHKYLQAPYITIDEATYLLSIKNIKNVDFSLNKTDSSAPKFCDGDSCLV